MTLKRALLAALLPLALIAGDVRAEQLAITNNGAPLNTTDGAHSVPRTTTQTYGPGFKVGGSNGAATITLGPLPTSCVGLDPGTLYDAGGSVPGICRDATYLALNSGGHLLLNSGGALLLNQ